MSHNSKIQKGDRWRNKSTQREVIVERVDRRLVSHREPGKQLCNTGAVTFTMRYELVARAKSEGPWRVGRTLGRTLYYLDEVIGLVDTKWIASQIVAALNQIKAERTSPADRELKELMAGEQPNYNFISSLSTATFAPQLRLGHSDTCQGSKGPGVSFHTAYDWSDPNGPVYIVCRECGQSIALGNNEDWAAREGVFRQIGARVSAKEAAARMGAINLVPAPGKTLSTQVEEDAKVPERFPEHAKLHQIAEKSQACGDFLEFLREKYTFCTYHKHTEECGDGTAFGGHTCGMGEQTPYPESANVKRLLAEFFHIDENKLEREKDVILEEQRKLNNG